MKIKIYYLIGTLVLLISSCTSKKEFTIVSPDKNLELVISHNDDNAVTNDSIYFTILSNNTVLVKKVSLGLEFLDMEALASNLIVTNKQYSEFNENWERVWGKRKIVKNQYNELILSLEEKAGAKRKMDLYFRIYNDGIAFRYGIPEQEAIKSFNLTRELSSFQFAENYDIWSTIYDWDKTHQENPFLQTKLSEFTSSYLPLIVNVSDKKWLAITEANLTDWSGMHLVPDSLHKNKIDVVLATRRDSEKIVVKAGTPALSPWRVVMIGDSPGRLLESDLIQNLNEPCEFEDVSWIEPGKSAWDWWWCNSYSPDVDFKLHSNNKTMKHFIDFASEMNWEYQLIDWHWYGDPFDESWKSNPDRDITKSNPDINIPELVEYAKSKNVKLMLWLEWEHANRQMEEAFALYEKWGIAGVKIDFMKSEDQQMVEFYHRVAKMAAKHHLLVDFHGAYIPTGISRKYPNLITREGVLGNEYSKWSTKITPEHTITLAFTRNILGEMDFTPGAFVNVTKENFINEDKSPTPMVMGTRCNQLAMMVVFESALQVLCDAPFNYRNSPAGLDFLKIVPTTWDDTKVLNEEMGNYITVARKSGNEWFIGSMTDWDERELDISLDFLDNINYTATIWKDGQDANINPKNLKKEILKIDNTSIIKAKLAKGGGHVIHLVPIK